MPTAVNGKLGRFRSPAARGRFEAAYERALDAWPATTSQRDVVTQFGTTHVVSCGAPDGAPIVLLPAIAVSAASWFANAGPLAAQHRVHAIDIIGDVGRSVQEVPVRNGAALAVWLSEVFDGLGVERAHLVGLSYGGWVALNQAARAAERLASVTAIDPPGAITRARTRFMLEILPDALLAKLTKSDRPLLRLLQKLNDGVVPAEPLLGLSVTGLRCFIGRLPRPRRVTDTELASISTPTLLLIGERSPLTNSRAAVARARQHIAKLDADIVSGAGHMLPVQNPAIFNERLLRFIDAVNGQTG